MEYRFYAGQRPIFCHKVNFEKSYKYWYEWHYLQRQLSTKKPEKAIQQKGNKYRVNRNVRVADFKPSKSFASVSACSHIFHLRRPFDLTYYTAWCDRPECIHLNISYNVHLLDIGIRFRKNLEHARQLTYILYTQQVFEITQVNGAFEKYLTFSHLRL